MNAHPRKNLYSSFFIIIFFFGYMEWKISVLSLINAFEVNNDFI